MKRPGFFEGVLVAFIAALSASLLYSSAILWLSSGSALRLVVILLSLGYAIYLLRRSRMRIGRVTTIGGWAMVSLLTLTPALSLSTTLLLHGGFIWLLRSRYLHASALVALLDLGLVALGLAAAVWATLQSGSLFLAVWSLFLIQALFIFLPNAAAPHHADTGDAQDPFAQAHRSAQSALRRLNPNP